MKRPRKGDRIRIGGVGLSVIVKMLRGNPPIAVSHKRRWLVVGWDERGFWHVRPAE